MRAGKYGTWVNEPLFLSLTRGLISGLVSYYRLPYITKLSSSNSSFIPCWYLPARIIATLYHYGHELKSQIFLTIYFRTRFFFWDKKFCINIFCRDGVLQDVLGLEDVLEDTFSSPWPWPQTLKSSKTALSSAREQHYFLYRLKRQKPRGKFAKTFLFSATADRLKNVINIIINGQRCKRICYR